MVNTYRPELHEEMAYLEKYSELYQERLELSKEAEKACRCIGAGLIDEHDNSNIHFERLVIDFVPEGDEEAQYKIDKLWSIGCELSKHLTDIQYSILIQLFVNRMTVGEISKERDIAPSTVSKHKTLINNKCKKLNLNLNIGEL